MAQIPPILDKLLTALALALAALNDVFEKRKNVVKAIFGALVAILCLLIGILLSQRYLMEDAGAKPSETAQTSLRMTGDAPSIPVEDIFLPDEPDYLPKVILEREPHTWSVEDAREYWTNPLENERINWRGTITNVVDDIMDKVP